MTAIYFAIHFLLLLVCTVDTAILSNQANRLHYTAKHESDIFGNEQVNTTILFTVEPVQVTKSVFLWYQINLVHVTHSIASHGLVTYPNGLLGNVYVLQLQYFVWATFKIFLILFILKALYCFMQNRSYFSSSPAGVIQNIYYAKEDLEEIVHLKKSVLSTLSGHLEDNQGSEWDYNMQEVDHAGKAEHYYQAKQTENGKTYHKQKRFNPLHIHNKEYQMNHKGVLTNIISHEIITLFNHHLDPTDGSKEKSGSEQPEEAEKVESHVHMKLMDQSLMKKTEHVSESKIKQMINDSIQFNLDEEIKTYTLSEVNDILENGLECTRHHGRVTSKRAECVMDMRNSIENVAPSNLRKIGNYYLAKSCKKTKPEECQHDRDLLIDLIAREGSSTAQSLILQHVFNKNEESEIQRSLFHFTQLEQPTKETVDATARLCFGKDMEHHGIMKMLGNQRRSCMALGALLKHYDNIDKDRTTELLDHLHTWLQTDREIEHRYSSNILRDPRNVAENEERLQFVHSKSVLLHALGNAAHPRSRDHIAVYAEPNSGHADVRHTAMQALRHYTCKESATLLLNASINDEDRTIKKVAHNTYMQHPKAGKLSFTDENILISKDHKAEKYLRAKRTADCNLLEKLTFDKRLDFPGFDWSEKVGNNFIGADFGMKMENLAHLHQSPVSTFFELDFDNRAWINSWVTLVRRRNYLVYNQEACFKRSYRAYNISTMMDFNVDDIFSEYQAFQDVYNEIVEPIIDSVNDFYYILQDWKENSTKVNLGLGLRNTKNRLLGKQANITNILDLGKDTGAEWVNETFGSMGELIQDINELKGNVINSKNEISDAIHTKKEEWLGLVQVTYEDATHIIQAHINDFINYLGISFDLYHIDECLGSLQIINIMKDPDQAGEDTVECLKNKLSGVVDMDIGLMGQVNKLLRTVRQLQNRYQNITNKIEQVKLIVENIQAGSWKFVVKKLLQRHQGFVDEMATTTLDFINSIMDDMGMNLQYMVQSINEANQLIEKAARLIKDSPQGAMMDITRAVGKMRVSQALFDRLNLKFTEMGGELQGKLGSWMEAGVEHDNLIRGLKHTIDLLNTVKHTKESVDNIKHVGSPREKLEMAVKEVNSIDVVAPLLEGLVEDFESIRYIADDYLDSFSRIGSGMEKVAKSFEKLKRGAEGAKTLVQKVFGVKFHQSFPKQVKSECEDSCGGCGIYPNIVRGRRGTQLLAESGEQIVAPLDSRVVPIEGSSDEVMIYPVGADMSDYEVILTYVKPIQQVYDGPEGYFADAGVVIGEAVTSPCKPNFIHVAVRKLNSTVQSESKSTFGLEKKHPGLPAHSYDTCGSQDLGEYISSSDFINPIDPNPMFMEGCSKAEFKHIDNFFDVVPLADKPQNLQIGFDSNMEDVGDRIKQGTEVIPEYPQDIDWTAVEDMTTSVEESCSKFAYDLHAQVTKPIKDIQYAFDEHRNWRKKVSYTLPHKIPKMSDFFDTMNFTVSGFGDFLRNAGLDYLNDELIVYAENLAAILESNMCHMLSKNKPSKLRHELHEDGGFLDGSKDFIKLQLETIKMKGCSHIVNALTKGEEHFCEVDPSSNCQVLECITKNKFDDQIIEIPVGIGFDPCGLKIHIAIGTENIEVEFDKQNFINTVNTSIGSVNHINITASVSVQFHILSRKVTVDVVLKGCHTLLPMCFGYTPVFKKLTFKFGDSFDNEQRCHNGSNIKFSCQSGENSVKYTQPSNTAIQTVLDMKMDDFLYYMNRFNMSQMEISNIINMNEIVKAAINKVLSNLAGQLQSIIRVKELLMIGVVFINESINYRPIDIRLFWIPFKIPPLTISISCGATIRFGLGLELNIIRGNNVSITPQVSVGAYTKATGKIAFFGTGVKLIMKGTLLETVYKVQFDVTFSNFPITTDKSRSVELIPLGVDFDGKLKILFIPIDFLIFLWRAHQLTSEPEKTTNSIPDISPPQFEWLSNHGSNEFQLEENGMCLVEQLLARHWSDPAFLLEAPFYDPESLLHVEYCIGTYQDGTDVLGWSVMEGVSMIVPIHLKVTGIPLYYSVKATNTDGKSTVVRCILDTYDVTPATGRFEASHVYTSHPSKLSGSLMVIEDSPLTEEQYTSVGMARGYLGDQMIEWYQFKLKKDPVNKEGDGELAYYAAARTGKLTSQPIKSTKTQYDHECAKLCRDLGDGCASFDFDYNSDACDLHWTIQGKAADLVLKGAYHNYEKLGAGYAAYFDYDGLNLIHGEAFYLNARITNVRGYDSYLTSHEIIVDFTCPEPGPIGAFSKDETRNDNCSAAITHGERCIEVTPLDNHRHIIDGPGAATVFNGNFPKYDMLYTISNHYMTANWDGFHDHETDIWGYTWSAGSDVCMQDVQEWDDPHSHLADKSYWTHQGLSSDLLLPDGPYYVTVQALNSVEFGGALVTSVCHSTAIIVDTTAPWLDFVEDVFYDEDFDLMGVYYKASDPESGILRTDIGLGETKHDVFVRAYSRHDPLHDGYEMISVDGVDLPVGIPVWVRVRVVNNVEMLTADHASQPLMVDPTPPVTGSVLDGDDHLFDMQYQPYNDRMCVQWYEWFDSESGIDRFLWGIGNSPNNTDVMDFVEYDHYTRSACQDIQVNHSQTYYNIIMAYNKAINSRNSKKSSDGITVDITEPIAGWVHDGKERSKDIIYSSQAASVFTNWGDYYDPESDIDEYVVTVAVNGVDREEFTMTGEEYLEDHTLHFQHGDYVQVTVEAENGATLKNDSQSTGYTVDLTPPDVLFVNDHPQNLKYQVSDTEMYAHWLFEDEESKIKEYRMRIIKHKGRNSNHLWPADTKYKIYTPRNDRNNEFEVTIDELKLQSGIRYSVEVTAVNGAGLGSKQDSLGVTVDTTPPVMSKIYIGSFGADEDLNDDNEVIHDDHYGIQTSWVGYDHESGIIRYMVAVGTSEGDSSVSGGYRDFGTESDGYIDGISLNVTAETGVLYYVSIYTINGAGVHSEVLSSRAIHVYGENVPGVVYDGRDIYVDKDYTTDMVTFAVSFQGFDSPACGIRAYEWSLGSEPGYSDILPYSSYGIVMLNVSHAITQIHIPLKHGDIVYASVRAHTGHRCSEAILYSCSDGIVIDNEPPMVEFITLGVFGNDTEDEITITTSLYQMDYNSIALEWNTTDLTTDTLNDTWMAGSLPRLSDKHEPIVTTDNQIPIRAVSMTEGETTIFTVVATDMAGNVKYAVAPSLTVDITEPLVEGFECTEFLSLVQTEVSCEWTLTLDHESPIIEQRLAIGDHQMEEQILPYIVLPYSQYSWKKILDDLYDKIANKSGAVITLQVVNKVGLVSSVFSRLITDSTPPVVGNTYITTPVTPGEEKQVKICQQSLSTMEVSWDVFTDRDSGIHHYEVGIGTSPGKADLSTFRNVGITTSVFLDQVPLTTGTQVFASVRAVNHARLVSSSTSAGVYISPNPKVEVWDGLGDKDMDFQNDLSSISGQVFLSEHCPIQLSNWTAYDILGNKVVNETEFFKERFANDELRLINFRTYYVVVEMIDAINRTLRAKSDGVMMVIQPPKPGEVRDGPYYGEDRNYQDSTSELSINWDPFGDDDDPLNTIVRYEVAIGDNAAYRETRTNVHYFEDVGLSLNHTFYHLQLTPKRVQYFGTVKGHSESGATIESVSNGIWVGYSPGMEAGEVNIMRYWKNATSLNFYWDKFHSDFRIIHYRWALGLTPFADDNVTLPCKDVLPMINKWANVQPLVDEARDTLAEKHNLLLEHATSYYVVTVAEDEASQCISAPTEMFTVDLTPPIKGKISVEGISKHVQYTTSSKILSVSWKDYKDDESGVAKFFIQLMKEINCIGSLPDKWEPIGDELDVKDTDQHTYLGLKLELGIPYRIVLTVTNGAGLTTQDWSDPIFLDTNPAVEGTVNDGNNWENTKYYQSSTSELNAIFAISPIGSALDCPLVENVMPPDNVTWNILNDYVIKDEVGNHYKGIYIDYQERNIKEHSERNTEILFHYNISSIALEGGALVSEPRDMLEGEYTVKLKGPRGEKTIFSLTLSNGWMDEYTDFELPIVTDQLTDEEFMKVAKSGDLDFDRGLDVSIGTTEEPPEPTTALPTTPEPTIEYNETVYNYRDGFESYAVGIHVLGFPFGNRTLVWMVLFWARDVEGIKSNWIYRDQDPALEMATYKLDIERDMTEADALWNVYFSINGIVLAEMNGINLPLNYTIKMRHWTHDHFVPTLIDPFNPFFTSSIVEEFTVPLPKERPCQFGNAFYDMESGVENIYVGVSNSTSKIDNIVPFQLVHELCHSCEVPCDYYKCSDDCNPMLNDGYQIITVHLNNLTLDPGDMESEEEMLLGFDMDDYNYEVDADNKTAYISERYYVLIKTVNGAGLEKVTSSPGIKIDITSPVLDSIEATDPEYNPLVPTAYQWSNSTLAGWWVFEDKESPIWEYRVAVGTTPNATDIVAYTSVGTATEVILRLDVFLDVGTTYFLTVEAINAAGLSTFASTDGVTIHSISPDVSNSTSKPLYSDSWPPGSDPDTDNDYSVYLSEFQHDMGISFSGVLEDNVYKLVWGTGESKDDHFITSAVEVDKREFDWTTLEIRQDGFFYFGGVKSEIHLTWLAQRSAQVNMTNDGEYVDPGRLLLEPGRCIYHQLYAQNTAHLRTLISNIPVCIKRQEDHVIMTKANFTLDYQKGHTKVSLSGQGIAGALISLPLDHSLYDMEYMTSANISFVPFIVNPKETMDATSRFMANRLLTFTNRSIVISPASISYQLQPMEITMSYSNISWDPLNETVAILYWDKNEQKWFNVEESSLKPSVLSPATQEVKGWFSGPIKKDDIMYGIKRPIHLTEPHMFAMFVITFNHQNSEPVLLSRLIVTTANEGIEKQLLYYDNDGDLVKFDLISEAQHGIANITDGGLLTYIPDEYYYGWDEINITMTETTVPPGVESYVVQEKVKINVREIPYAPWLFLELAAGLNKTRNRWRFFTDNIEVQYEANTTTKTLGTLYICDLNPSDVLNLTWINIDSENVSVSSHEIDSTGYQDSYVVGANLYCVEKNLKVFIVVLETTEDYFGYDQVQFIGYDNFTLYSQVIQVNVYTLMSPCGDYGVCTSPHDPDCQSNDRSKSYDRYSCNCDNWHDGSWCDILDVLKITLICIGTCWLSIIVVFGLVKTRKNYVALHKVVPIVEDTELDVIDKISSHGESEDSSEPEDDGDSKESEQELDVDSSEPEDDGDSDESEQELDVEPVKQMNFSKEAPVRYQKEFRTETRKNWIAPETIAGGDVAAAASDAKPKGRPKKKVKKRKTMKKSKVHAL